MLSVLAFFALLATATPLQAAQDQKLLTDTNEQAGNSDLIDKLKQAEIIPTVLDTFTPLLTLSIFWENATAEVGNTLDPSKLQQAPDVQFIEHAPTTSSISTLSNGTHLTLALTDPDAPSREDPKWSQMCHWIATSVAVTKPGAGDLVTTAGFSPEVEEVMPYKGPGPPPKTGKHRYVFAALAPRNRTTEKLSLRKPSERKFWGYGEAGKGLRDWAEENGLEVVGANFIYAENEEQ